MKRYCCIVFFLFYFSGAKAQKLTDTIFYNQKWEICEKPIAEYYRIGTLAIDSFWFFIGHVQDFTMSNVLMMDGNYTQDGYKTGSFSFFYPNGNLLMKGNYTHDKMLGYWNFFYDNGKPKATIYLREKMSEFTVLNYFGDKGDTLMINGTGSFSWSQNEVNPNEFKSHYGYTLEGEYKDTLRNGTWKYYEVEGDDTRNERFKESYKKGELTKAMYYGYYGGGERVNAARVTFDFQPYKIQQTENMRYDEFLRKGIGDSAKAKDENFMNYIVNGESPVITVNEKEFTRAISRIISTLDKYSYKIDHSKGKDIDGEIEFKISESGHPEDITVKGNISEKEVNFIKYIMDKFKGIEMPVIEGSIAISGYHKFYFYTFNTRPFIPASLVGYVPEKDFIFSSIPRDKFLLFAKTIKGNIRRMINRM
jgi:hypothetical protein